MTERKLSEDDYDIELLTVSKDVCQKIVDTGTEIVKKERIKDQELSDLLRCGGLYINPNSNVGTIARFGVHAPRRYIDSVKKIRIGTFFLSYNGTPQAPSMDLEEAHSFVLTYAQRLGFLKDPDLFIAGSNLKETSRPKWIKLKHETLPVEMSLRFSGDLKAEGFRLNFVTR